MTNFDLVLLDIEYINPITDAHFAITACLLNNSSNSSKNNYLYLFLLYN